MAEGNGAYGPQGICFVPIMALPHRPCCPLPVPHHVRRSGDGNAPTGIRSPSPLAGTTTSTGSITTGTLASSPTASRSI